MALNTENSTPPEGSWISATMADHETYPPARFPSAGSVLHESPTQESLPPLLQLISDGDYACIGCASETHSAIDVSKLDPSNNHATGLDRQPHDKIGLSKGTSSSKSSSADISPNVSAIDIPADALHSLHQRSSKLSAPLLKRGAPPHSPLEGGAFSASRGLHSQLSKKVSFTSKLREKFNNMSPANGDSMHGGSAQAQHAPARQDARQKASKRKCFSQPMPSRDRLVSGMHGKKGPIHSGPVRRCNTHVDAVGDHDMDIAKEANYVMFRTRSNRYDKHLSPKQSRESQRGGDDPSTERSSSKDACDEAKSVPAGRYFDALRGPELEFVKDSEELLLPVNQKWPFLLRFPIGCFGICLGLGSQAVLYKALATLPSMSFLKIPLAINFILWCLALTALVVISITYGLKCLLYFEAVRREYYHPVRVNFFFAPWVACMFLTVGIPPRIAKSIHPAVWCIFTTPLLLLKLKIYGQWLSGGKRRLSKVANPTTHLSLVGNFVSALLAAIVGWDEPAMFFWAVGCAHYLVVFVTLYQRLPTAEVLPKELHPVFFLFVAAPSVASVAWKNISGNFDRVSRVAYFLALFLYSSLVVRINFFCGFKFSVTWWAYTFPMTASAIATINYAVEVRHPITQGMAVMLSCISSVVVMSVFISTVYHIMKGTLFPNDVAIAITRKPRRRKQKGSKVDPMLESMSKQDEDDSTKLIMASEGGNIVASLENGLVSVTSDPFPQPARESQSKPT